MLIAKSKAFAYGFLRLRKDMLKNLKERAIALHRERK